VIPKKIFLGNTDIGSVVTEFKIVFKEKYNIETLSYYDADTPPSKIVSCKVDHNLYDLRNSIPYFRPRRISTRLKKVWEKWIDTHYFNKAVKECDVFIFFWNTFKKDHSDLEVLKQLGKKIIVCFVGDDARWYYSQKQELQSYGLRNIEYDNYDFSVKGLEQRLSYVRNAEKYADFIFSRLDQQQLGLRPYYRWHMMIDSSKYENKNLQRKECPVIAHAPTARKGKGTEYVLEVFERLEKEGIRFRKLLIENLDHASALKAYSDADIVIDQLICTGSGKLASEALGFGKVVLSHMAYDTYPQNLDVKDYPIVDVNPDTLYTKLKELILDHEARQRIADLGHAFAVRTLDFTHFCDKVLKLVDGEQIPHDYTPTFFREKFIPESEESVQVYNKWTDTVKNCDWYKANIKPGERAGLKF
jgi:glycosyltransferase involved in cell wall biosynthesis